MDLVDDCPYKVYLSNILGIESVTKSSALVHGSVWHKIMEVFYGYIKKNGWSDVSGAIYASGKAAKDEWLDYATRYQLYEDYRNFQTEMEMLTSYISNYSVSDEGFLDIIATEEKFELLFPILSYNTSIIEEITYSGIIDLRCRINGMPWLIDHKTTAGNISKEASKLNRSIQFIGYSWAENILYNEAEGFLANFAGCSSRKKKDGTWGAKNIQFQRHPQLFSSSDYDIFIHHVNLRAKALHFYLERNYFPKNYKSCYNYGRCGMYSQCQSCSTEPVEGYRYAEGDDVRSPIQY
jgi:hypothetical protein